MDRIDVLGSDPERLAAFSDGMLEAELDEDLQRMVEQAAAALGAPIALVSLVLERVQFFRAHTGLPEDLAVTQATDRDVSFCQLVVRDGDALEVKDAPNDARVPQELVKRYGIGAYLGVPLKSGDHTLGSLCVIDMHQREFTDAHRDVLARLAEEVVARLHALVARRRPLRLLSAAAGPAFAELRNVLMPISSSVAAAKIAVAELAALQRLAAHLDAASIPALGSLKTAALAVDDLHGLLGDIEGAMRRLNPALDAVQQVALLDGRSIAASTIADIATELAFHHLKLVGHVRWTIAGDEVAIVGPRSVVASAVAAVLTTIALEVYELAGSQGIDAAIASDDKHVDFAFRANDLDGEAFNRVLTRLNTLLGADVDVVTGDDQIIVRLMRQRPSIR